MSRTRFIYFLSAIVLIIGCFALNTSYSLFVDNDSTQLVETTIPTITDEVTLSLSSVEVEGTKEYLIKQTITNNNSIPIGFRLTASSDSTTYQVQATTYEDDTYLSYGTVEANTSKDMYLRVANTNEDTSNVATINFSLESDYATLKMDTEEYLASANIDNATQYPIEIPALPYSDNEKTLAYHIIKKQIDIFGNESTKSDISSLFLEDINKITLPLETGFSVPSPTEFTSVETESVGIYQAEDDYGISYYYRGANDYNYVSFAGFTWRIVRINGDGSIRLILDGSLDKVTDPKNTSQKVYQNTALKALSTYGTSKFKNYYDDNTYVGYMHGTANSADYDSTHKNINDSTIKEYLDIFYEEYIASYDTYLADTLFCGDKTLASSALNSSNTEIGFGINTTYYATYERLFQDTVAKPTLECAKNAINTYSRYTSSMIDTSLTTIKGVLVNNDLKYPIALLSADELVMAGAFNKINKSYYLYDAYAYENQILSTQWWTMSPSSFNGSWTFNYSANNITKSFTAASVGTQYGVRPVINLKIGILVDDGIGTYGSPYTVKIN